MHSSGRFLTLVGETAWIEGKKTADDHSLFLSFILLIPMLVIILLHYNIPLKKEQAVSCRNLSAGIYYLHRASLAVVTVASLIVGFEVNRLLTFWLVLLTDALICAGAYKSGNRRLAALLK